MSAATSAAVPGHRQRTRPDTLADILARGIEHARRERIKRARRARHKARRMRKIVAARIASASSRELYIRVPSKAIAAHLIRWLGRSCVRCHPWAPNYMYDKERYYLVIKMEPADAND